MNEFTEIIYKNELYFRKQIRACAARLVYNPFCPWPDKHLVPPSIPLAASVRGPRVLKLRDLSRRAPRQTTHAYALAMKVTPALPSTLPHDYEEILEDAVRTRGVNLKMFIDKYVQVGNFAQNLQLTSSLF